MTGQNTPTAICEAMKKAGIADPDSHEGIVFCAGSRDGKIKSKCPYEYCIVFETDTTAGQERARIRTVHAKKYHELGVSDTDIALILGVSRQMVRKYRTTIL